MKPIPAPLTNLIGTQRGLVTRQQLLLHGFIPNDVTRRIHLGLWMEATGNVIATSTAPLDRDQLLWAASLHFPTHALTGIAALELYGYSPWGDVNRIDLIGPRGGRTRPMRHCRLHTTRRELKLAENLPRHTPPHIAALHAMAWTDSFSQAVVIATFVLQRKLAKLEDFYTEISYNRRSSLMRAALRVVSRIEPGTESLLEFDFGKQCIARGLPAPIRQTMRVDSEGRKRYTDFEFRIGNQSLVVEVDGRGHLAVDVMIDDQWRANDLTMQGTPVLRIPGIALRTEPDRFFKQLEQAIDGLRATRT